MQATNSRQTSGEPTFNQQLTPSRQAVASGFYPREGRYAIILVLVALFLGILVLVETTVLLVCLCQSACANLHVPVCMCQSAFASLHVPICNCHSLSACLPACKCMCKCSVEDAGQGMVHA